MKAPKQETSNIKPIEEGTINAVCYGLVDLGTQKTTFEGKESELPKIMIMFEVDETYEKDEKEYRRTIGAEFTFSLGNKSNLRKFLAGWIGNRTDDEWYDLDITELIGKPCLLNIVHKKSNKGNLYANVVSAAKLVKGMQPLEKQNASLIFDFECADKAELDKKIAKLPKYVADKVKLAKQYVGFDTPTDNSGDLIPIHDDNLPF